MTLSALISKTTPPLKTSDTVEHALGIMLEMRVRHLPVIDEDGILVSVVSEEQLLDALKSDATLDSLRTGGTPASGFLDDHVFDLTKTMVRHDLTTLPIIDRNRRYAGLIERHDIFDQFARMLSTQESGAILALEISPRDYSLAKLIHTVEQNDAKVLSVASEPPDEITGKLTVTLKLNTMDATRIRHVLAHHGYNVVASFGESEDEEELLLRVQEFMRYLEV
ncbi:MAG TPA: CBS domain-containing protein [Rhodothermales bacterium]